MLLNQCLAISLSPTASIDFCRHRKSPQVETTTTTTRSKKPKKQLQAGEVKQADIKSFNTTEEEGEEEEEDTPVAIINLTASSASTIFQRFVKLNLPSSLEEQTNLRSNFVAASKSDRFSQLGAAVRRVEFAGFVLPSWLLLSGSYNDLHCIKTGWSEGMLRSPAGFRIETIGNIRSVNIDYFGSPQNKWNHLGQLNVDLNDFEAVENKYRNSQQQQQQQAIAFAALETAETEVAAEGEQVLQQQQQPQQQIGATDCKRLSRSKSKIRKFAPLNAAILESIVELRRQSHEDKLLLRNNNTSEEEEEEDFSNNNNNDSSFGVHIGKLIEHLNRKYANQIDLPPVEFIDCAINGLVRSEQLSIRPMSQKQMELNYKQQAARNSLNQTKHCESNKLLNNSQQHQSVFLDQLIGPGQELLRQFGLQTESAALNWSNSTQPKSKSTTLDSGIRSWDLGENSPTYQDTTASDSSSAGSGQSSAASFPSDSGGSREPFRNNNNNNSININKETLATCYKATGGANSLLLNSHHNRHHDSHYPRSGGANSSSSSGANDSGCSRAEQVDAGGVSNAIASSSGQIVKARELDIKDGRRGFSLTRSISFRQKKGQGNRKHQGHHRPEQTSRLPDETGDRWNCVVDSNCNSQEATLTATVNQKQTIISSSSSSSSQSSQSGNLTSLFRSKSMRIISSGKGDRFRWQPGENLATTCSLRRHGDEEREINCDHHQQPLKGHLSHLKDRRTLEIGAGFRNELERQEHSKVSKQMQPATTTSTIDYLATAQPHKRSLSVRRNSFLSFNNNTNSNCSPKSDLGGGGNATQSVQGGGRIAVFLRKLFTGGKPRSRSMLDQQRAGPDSELRLRLADRQVATSSSSSVTTGERPEELSGTAAPLPGKEEAAAGATWTLAQTGSHTQYYQQQQPKTRALASLKSVSASPTSSSASSGSNSLIEILDCSPAVNRTKRTLRQDPGAGGSGGGGGQPNRATSWRLVKRSDSSLSQNSDDSCSTTKSTVSQQLRRHLDEAYRRHRGNCTNKREKEFIDSINVLRQASRHALQNSRSPSTKSRHGAKGGGGGGSMSSGAGSSRAKSSASNDTTTNTTSSLSGSSLPLRHHDDDDDDDSCVISGGPTSPNETTCSRGAQCHCKQRASTHLDLEYGCINNNNNNNYHQVDDDDLNQSRANQTDLSHQSHHNHHHQPGPLLLTRKPDEQQQQQFSMETDPCLSLRRLADGQHQPASSQTTGAGCCLCSTYQQQLLSTCPLACWPGAPTSPPLPPAPQQQQQPLPAACCCFVATATRLPHIGSDSLNMSSPAASDSHHHNRQQQQPVSSDLCCPLWRSMLYAYCQPPIYPAPPPPLPLTNLLPPLPLSSFSQQQVSEQLQHQQHQHNTTIDLKIEIGADFNNDPKQRARGRSFRPTIRTRGPTGGLKGPNEEEAEVSAATSESLEGGGGGGDDSLDSSGGHQSSDESSSLSSSGMMMASRKVGAGSQSDASDVGDGEEDDELGYTSLEASELAASDSLRNVVGQVNVHRLG